MQTSPKIGKRIRNRLRVFGYWKGGRPDVSRFCCENGYLPQYVYAWLKGRVPAAANLVRLGTDLGVAPAWLLFGNNGMDGWMGAEVRQFLRPRSDGPDRARLIPQVPHRQESRPRARAAAP